MSNPAERFVEHQETIRAQLQEAIAAYQRLARLDLSDMTRENATEMYQEYVDVEATLEGVGGALDRIRAAIHQVGECVTDQLEEIGFDGARRPTITEIVEDEEYGAAASE